MILIFDEYIYMYRHIESVPLSLHTEFFNMNIRFRSQCHD